MPGPHQYSQIIIIIKDNLGYETKKVFIEHQTITHNVTKKCPRQIALPFCVPTWMEYDETLVPEHHSVDESSSQQ